MSEPKEDSDHISREEALNFLQMAKNGYLKALTGSQGPNMISQYRTEMRYWEDYIFVNLRESTLPEKRKEPRIWTQ